MLGTHLLLFSLLINSLVRSGAASGALAPVDHSRQVCSPVGLTHHVSGSGKRQRLGVSLVMPRPLDAMNRCVLNSSHHYHHQHYPGHTIPKMASANVQTAATTKANEFDELRAEKLRIEVELEQSVRTADSRVKSMKGQLDEALRETQELRKRAGDSGLYFLH